MSKGGQKENENVSSLPGTLSQGCHWPSACQHATGDLKRSSYSSVAMCDGMVHFIGACLADVPTNLCGGDCSNVQNKEIFTNGNMELWWDL